ncbi:5-formyltetrahydrofolate cyclo-ligase [Actinoplanes sichuanensis]|uniref:5-formyltetrahydrofolate cyclo-ligase n=1 Tax=Actinoplanes sichuanensis TaxID=512349 RepID=A0ABW4APS8_9ACTN|nr:5-formyltetrahydrofolate cyclo-ligase [Actinoplanes sichuanensis]BEL11265.1 5-formyltetrahydrofolate cyclo-ligase [Actinoplanes sichuanensis]
MSDLTPDAEKSHQIKIALRARLLTVRRSLPVTALDAAAAKIQGQILALVRRTGARSIAAYVPIGPEPGGTDLPDRLLAALPRDGRLLLPVLLPDNDLTWAELTAPTSPPAAQSSPTSTADSPTPTPGPPTSAPAPSIPGSSLLVAGPRGLREPGGPRLGVEAVRSVDLLLVPALAVGPDGTRMGRGGGSYDRVLARLPDLGPLTVALLHDGEDVPFVPAEPHDRRVHAVITPTGGFSRRPHAS